MGTYLNLLTSFKNILYLWLFRFTQVFNNKIEFINLYNKRFFFFFIYRNGMNLLNKLKIQLLIMFLFYT